MDNNNLSVILKERRREKGLTLRQLGSESGISLSYLGRIERGERFPSGLCLRKLAAPLGFSETKLLKLAGVLSRDDRDERLEEFRKSIKREIFNALSKIYAELDRL